MTDEMKEKRHGLIELSQCAKVLVKEGVFSSVNEALLAMYADGTEINEFNTLKQWNEKGYRVRKGEKAFLVWGQPRQAAQVSEGSAEPEEYKFWPVCFLFADTQVFKAEALQTV
jgi:hypothetical protein